MKRLGRRLHFTVHPVLDSGCVTATIQIAEARPQARYNCGSLRSTSSQAIKRQSTIAGPAGRAAELSPHVYLLVHRISTTMPRDVRHQGLLSIAKSGYLRSETSSKKAIQRFRNPLPLHNSQHNIHFSNTPPLRPNITEYSLCYCFRITDDTQVPPRPRHGNI